MATDERRTATLLAQIAVALDMPVSALDRASECVGMSREEGRAELLRLYDAMDDAAHRQCLLDLARLYADIGRRHRVDAAE